MPAAGDDTIKVKHLPLHVEPGAPQERHPVAGWSPEGRRTLVVVPNWMVVEKLLELPVLLKKKRERSTKGKVEILAEGESLGDYEFVPTSALISGPQEVVPPWQVPHLGDVLALHAENCEDDTARVGPYQECACLTALAIEIIDTHSSLQDDWHSVAWICRRDLLKPVLTSGEYRTRYEKTNAEQAHKLRGGPLPEHFQYAPNWGDVAALDSMLQGASEHVLLATYLHRREEGFILVGGPVRETLEYWEKQTQHLTPEAQRILLARMKDLRPWDESNQDHVIIEDLTSRVSSTLPVSSISAETRCQSW